MKIFVIDNDNIQKQIDPKSVVIDNITLGDMIKRFNEMEKQFNRLVAKFEKREKQLIEVVEKL